MLTFILVLMLFFSFGSKHVSPRTLTSRYLGNLVCVEGIVTKCSLIRPKVVRSVHYCPATKKTIERRYTDMTSLKAFPSTAAYPTKVNLMLQTCLDNVISYCHRFMIFRLFWIEGRASALDKGGPLSISGTGLYQRLLNGRNGFPPWHSGIKG